MPQQCYLTELYPFNVALIKKKTLVDEPYSGGHVPKETFKYNLVKLLMGLFGKMLKINLHKG